MIHQTRWGFVLGGLLIMGPGLALGALALVVGEDCGGDVSCPNRVANLVTLGGIEAVGAALLAVGLVGHEVPAPALLGRNVAFLPFATPQAQGLSMSMHW
jgi:hypothetical protein